MSRLYFIFTFLGGIVGSCLSLAKDIPQENLYIPEGAFATSEKLPPIRSGIYNDTTSIKKAYHTNNEKESANASTSNYSLPSDRAVQNQIKSSTSTKLDTHDKPDYKEKYDKYLDDLEIIGETGKIPNNPELNSDLMNMNSDKKFEI